MLYIPKQYEVTAQIALPELSAVMRGFFLQDNQNKITKDVTFVMV